ncbi:MAG: DUF2723 domain-containing protein [Planctomycetota bacterium]
MTGLTSALAFLLPLAVYVRTLAPSIVWGDGGELAAAAHVLGVAHPPGHPLSTLLGKFFMLLRAGSVAWRMNLMSAFFGAFSAWLVSRLVVMFARRMFPGMGERQRSWAALAAAGIFAAGSIAWDSSVAAETTTIHVAFMLAQTWLLFRVAELPSGEARARGLAAWAFLMGVSFANHIAGLYFLPAAGVVLLGLFRNDLKENFFARHYLVSGAAFLLGLTVYAYLPIRAAANPPINWGDPGNWSNFKWVVGFQQYRYNIEKPLITAAGVAMIPERLGDLVRQLSIPGSLLVVGGMVLAAFRARVFLAYAALVTGTLFLVVSNPAFIGHYLLPGVALLAVFAGLAVAGLLAARWRPLKLAGGLALLLPAALVPVGWHENDRSADTTLPDYAGQILNSLPPRSLLLTTDGQILFAHWYLKFCERRHTDKIVADPGWFHLAPLSRFVIRQNPGLLLPTRQELDAVPPMFQKSRRIHFHDIYVIMRKNARVRPVYWGVLEERVPFQRHLVPEGMVYRFSPDPVMNFDDAERACVIWWRLMVEGLAPVVEAGGPGARDVRENYAVVLNNLAAYWLDHKRPDTGLQAVQYALWLRPDYPPAHFNRGFLLEARGDLTGAEGAFRRANRLAPANPRAWGHLGRVLVAQGRMPEAREALAKGLGMDPNEGMILLEAGNLEDAAGNRDAASGYYRRVMAANPGSLLPYLKVGRYALEAGQARQAAFFAERAAALAPGAEEVKRLQADLENYHETAK